MSFGSFQKFLVEGTVFQIGVPPNRIDIIADIDGVNFDEAWPERKTTVVDGLEMPLIGKTRLLISKKATGRPMDLQDILWLERETDLE
ncbi:MAG: hypothetical protein ABIO36_01180 [Pyrinomonadaceae bacterium]